EVSSCATLEEARAHLDRQEFAIILAAAQEGLCEVLQHRVGDRCPPRHRTPIVLVGEARTVDQAAVELQLQGPVDVLLQPLSEGQIRDKIGFLAEIWLLRNEQLQLHAEAARIKEQFLGIVSHELRTPLHFILGAGSILEEGAVGQLSEPQRGCLSTIMCGANALLQQVNDLLDMVQIRAGQLDLQQEWVSLADAMAGAQDALLPAARHKTISIVVDVAAELPLAWADPRRLLQILRHLLGNALKFTPPGGQVVLRADQRAGHLHCELADTGMGLTDREAQMVFEPFWQADMSTTRRVRGIGLGLTLAKALVEAQGGIMGVRPDSPGGTVFWFTLPCEAWPA
ncbi:MAG: HAMP domain-containing histidine kinase, partial [Cyanobacteria bacterium REEB65]|nr:HAMP domain-containing histidine kinase [Cyanobacteria bacterium REEB65]